jgi:ADP-ribosylglycohydrolase
MSIEANRRARVSGNSTIKYWIENDIDIDNVDEMPIPHYRPHSYIKTSLLWAFYYLKHEKDLNEALKDILMKGGDTMANATIIGGLLAASQGMEAINKS